MAVNITTDTNTVKVTSTSTNNVKIVDNRNNTSVSVSQPTTRVIKVATVGPQGPTGAIPNTGSFATTGSNTFKGKQILSASQSDLSALDIHAVDHTLWALRVYNDLYSSTQPGLGSWIDNTGEANIGTEVNKPLYIYTNANYANPTLIISSSGVTVNNNLTVTGNQVITGSLIVSGSSTFRNIGPAVFSGSVQITGSLITKGATTNSTSASLLVQSSNTSSSIAVFGDNKLKVYSATNNNSLNLWSDDTYAYLGNSAIGDHIRMATSNTTYYTQAGFFSSGVEIKGSPWYGYVLNLDKGVYTSDDYLRFGTGRIDSSGSLGLGKTSPTAKLDISGSTFITGSLNITGSITQVGIQIVTGSTRGNVTALSITTNTASMDLSVGNFFTLQLVSGSNTHINPSNILPGQTSILTLSTTGSATVSWPSSVKQPSGSAYIPTTTAGIDIVTLASVDSSTLYVVNVKNMI